ncbi:phage tail protein [Paenibacillus bouchesdurhonensis]|uniref:phage tail protein n=1 Tax=Paenibacillus bouchesdurhonensis TaxID=1870990 RepID=UPI000DA5EDD1|nr:phage tail protein [Paenibacillus bouchesdurhonensis]
MIKITSKEIKKVEKRLGQYSKKAPVVIYRALNRAASGVRTNANKKAREVYRIKAKDVNQTFTVIKASRGSLTAAATSKSGSIGLEKFRINASNPNSRPRKFKAAVKKQGSLKEIMRGFVASINGVKAFRRTSKSRLPIQRLFGPPVPQMVNNKEVRDFVEKQAVETYNKRLQHEIKRTLEGN